MTTTTINTVKPVNGEMMKLPFVERAMILDEKKEDHYIGYVYSTMDYSKFKKLKANRVTNQTHINRLIASIQKKRLFAIITVNEHFQIIDGQHRFEALKILELPINYVIANGYGLEEVLGYNAQQKQRLWNSEDILHSQMRLGNNEYIRLNTYMAKYEFPIRVCCTIAGNGNDRLQRFRDGSFKFNDYEYACKLGDILVQIIPNLGTFSKHRCALLALVNIIKNVQNFNHKHFINKLKSHSQFLDHRATINQWRELFHKIYNYKCNDSQKLELRAK